MLERLQDRTEASYLVTEIVTQIAKEDADINSKLRYIRRTIDFAKEAVAAEDVHQLRMLMLDPDAAKYFVGAQFGLQDGSYRLVAARNTEDQLSATMAYVAASGLVFAHSFFEHVLEGLLHITRLCDIGTWLSFINSKTITVSALLDSTHEVAVEAKLHDYMKALAKEGVLTKIDILASLLRCSITTSRVRDYTFDRARMAEIDTLRHELAHHRKKDYSIELAEADVLYLIRSCLHFLGLVVTRYDLHGAYRPTT